MRLFTCKACGYDFRTDTTEVEMAAEFEQIYSEPLTEEQEVESLCDTCHRILRSEMAAGRAEPMTPEEFRKAYDEDASKHTPP